MTRYLFSTLFLLVMTACNADQGDGNEPASVPPASQEDAACGPIGECPAELVCFEGTCVTPETLEDPTEGRLDSGSVNPPVVRSDSGAPLVPSDAGGASVAENDSGSSSAQLDDAGTAGSLADSGHVAASPNDSGSLGSLGTDAGTACAPCALGFTLNTADCSCTDTNECAANNGGCDQICVDSSFDAADDVALFFACSCEAGFALSSDGFSCAATDAGGSWADSGPAATQDGGTPGEANADAGQAIALNDGGGRCARRLQLRVRRCGCFAGCRGTARRCLRINRRLGWRFAHRPRRECPQRLQPHRHQPLFRHARTIFFAEAILGEGDRLVFRERRLRLLFRPVWSAPRFIPGFGRRRHLAPRVFCHFGREQHGLHGSHSERVLPALAQRQRGR